MKKAKVITALALTVVMLMVMAGLAAAEPGGAASPSEVTVDLPNDTPTDITFQFWDLSANTVNQSRFYMWRDNNGDGVGDDLDGDGTPQEIPDDLCDDIEMSWDGTTYYTESLIVNIPPSAWDTIESGQPSASETRYTKTIKVRDANNGATINDRYFIQGSTGSSVVPVQVLTTNTDITPVPEFATIAIPVAAILGLLFFYSHRKRKEE